MRRLWIAGAVLLFAFPLFAQPRPRRAGSGDALAAEMAVKRAIETLGEERRGMERDLKILLALQAADQSLVDPMQPSAAIQKAFEQVSEAERIVADFALRQAIVRMRQELENARRSPLSADFARLRALLRDDAIRTASRIVSSNALRLEEESLAWIGIQQMIGEHLRTLSQIAGDSLRAGQRD